MTNCRHFSEMQEKGAIPFCMEKYHTTHFYLQCFETAVRMEALKFKTFQTKIPVIDENEIRQHFLPFRVRSLSYLVPRLLIEIVNLNEEF